MKNTKKSLLFEIISLIVVVAIIGTVIGCVSSALKESNSMIDDAFSKLEEDDTDAPGNTSKPGDSGIVEAPTIVNPINIDWNGDSITIDRSWTFGDVVRYGLLGEDYSINSDGFIYRISDGRIFSIDIAANPETKRSYGDDCSDYITLEDEVYTFDEGTTFGSMVRYSRAYGSELTDYYYDIEIYSNTVRILVKPADWQYLNYCDVDDHDTSCNERVLVTDYPAGADCCLSQNIKGGSESGDQWGVDFNVSVRKFADGSYGYGLSIDYLKPYEEYTLTYSLNSSYRSYGFYVASAEQASLGSVKPYYLIYEDPNGVDVKCFVGSESQVVSKIDHYTAGSDGYIEYILLRADCVTDAEALALRDVFVDLFDELYVTR